MKTFDIIRTTVSHSLKDPHSKSLESDCLPSSPAIVTQSQGSGEAEKPFRAMTFD